MRYSFHRICFPCPERLPAPCSTASDELINIIKANLPHHFFLPRQYALLQSTSSQVGQVAADIREGIRHGRAMRKNCQAKGQEMKGRGKREKKEQERYSLQPVAAQKCHSARLCFVRCFRWRSTGIPAQFAAERSYDHQPPGVMKSVMTVASLTWLAPR